MNSLIENNRYKQIHDITPNYKVFDAEKLTTDFLNEKGKLIKKITNYNNQFDLSMVPNLTHLKMGDEFNQQITLPNSLTYLKIGWYFNQKITSTWLPNSLTHLELGFRFDQLITLPNSLTHLEMGYTFNQQIILPNSLVHLLKGYKNYIIKKIID